MRDRKSHTEQVRRILIGLVLLLILQPGFEEIPVKAQSIKAESPAIADSILNEITTTRGYPRIAEIGQNHPSFLEGSLGTAMTVQAKGQYSGVSWPYDYSIGAEVAATEGLLPYQATQTFNTSLGGGYIIGDGYGIFSGGHMGARVGYQQARYREDWQTQASERRISQWDAMLTGRNTYRGLTYISAGSYRVLQIAGDEATEEQAMEGDLSVTRRWGNWSVATDVALDLTYLSGTSISYGRLTGRAGYSVTGFRLEAGGAISVGENLTEPTVVRVAPVAHVHLQPFGWIALDGLVEGGVAPISLESLLYENPHMMLRSDVRHEEGNGYAIGCSVIPSRSFRLDVLGKRYFYDSRLYYTSLAEGDFGIRYAGARYDQVGGHITWDLGASDKMSMMAVFNDAYLEDGVRIPYVPRWNMSLSYEKRLDRLPGVVKGRIQYIGLRSTDGTASLDPVILATIEGTYNLNSGLQVMLVIDNVTDMTYELWDGYTERGVFASVGLTVRL